MNFNSLKRVHKYLLLLFILVGIFYSFLTQWVFSIFNIILKNPIENRSKYFQFFVGVIISPLIETLIFQYLIFILLRKIIKTKKLFNTAFLFAGTSVFSIAHSYSLYYIIAMIVPSFLLCYCFLYYSNEKTSLKYSFWFTTLFHASTNFLAFLCS